MKKYLTKLIVLVLCLAVMCSPVLGVSVLGVKGDYPDGVTAGDALAAVGGTDRLLNSAVPLLTGSNLQNLVKPMIYSSDTLSSVLLQMYLSFEAEGTDLSAVGIDTSVSSVANALSQYPEVSERLKNYTSWSEVDLTGVNWGVRDKNGFAEAFGAMFSPFNDVLYMLLSSGTLKISFIKINGADGYSNAVVPMLNALKCPDIIPAQQFHAEASTNKNSMVKNIILPILSFLEKTLDAPATTLTDSLPSFAYFSESGEMEKCMDSLMSPIKSNPLFEIATLLNLFDAEMFTFDIETIMGTLTSGMGGVQIAELDMGALSKCGTHNGTTFVSDQGKAYVVVMRWLVETLKLNPDLFNQLPGATVDKTTGDFMKNILSKDTDKIVGTIILLFSPKDPQGAEAMVYPDVNRVNVQYTPNLQKEDYERALGEMDDLLDDFVKEGGSYKDVESLLESAIYSNANINALLMGVYGAFEENGLTQVLLLLGVDTTPKGVASYLTEYEYKSAVNALNKADSWADTSLKNIDWGFYTGSRKGFQNTLTAVLRPLYPVMRVLLVEKDMVVLDSITIKGADGYNTAVIPLLEALGCDSGDILTYEKYKKHSDTDRVMKDILDPVFDLVDDICEKPVDTLTTKLPNIVYFLNSGSLEKCIGNLLLPITSFTETLSGVYHMDVDMTSLPSELDMNKLLGSMLESTGMKVAEFDINTLSGMGTPEKRTSKQVVDGKNTRYTYIVADKTDVFMSLLRVLARTMRLPGNENLLMGSMGSNASFETYSASLTEQFENMSEDELIEWLFNLFFKERVKAELVFDENYSPTIIYKETEKNYVWLYVVCGYLGLCAVVGIIIYANRKRLYS
ncbi:MAG: hypothetical protein E7530_03130 [Ruminococcaceae bacterium]|nr:hypothetical protein [Oscillospiraceae bacterium]